MFSPEGYFFLDGDKSKGSRDGSPPQHLPTLGQVMYCGQKPLRNVLKNFGAGDMFCSKAATSNSWTTLSSQYRISPSAEAAVTGPGLQRRSDDQNRSGGCQVKLPCGICE